MKKLNKLFSNHKMGCLIGSGVFFGILLLFFTIVFIIPSFGNNNYGNRLANEAKYKVSSNTIDDIKDSISNQDGVKKVTYNKEGRILNFTIKLESDVVLDTGKKYAEEVVNKLSEKNLKYYDVQVFLDADDNNSYPIIGYHAKGTSDFSWGNVGR